MTRRHWMLAGVLLALFAGALGAQATRGSIGSLLGSTTVTGSIPALNVAIVDSSGDQIVDFVGSSFAPDCNTTAAVSISSSGNNEIIPLVSGQIIDVCSITLVTDGTVDVQFVYGTGTACATGETNLSGTLGLGIAGTAPPGFSGRGLHVPLVSAAAQAFCIELSGAVAVEGWVEYVQYSP